MRLKILMSAAMLAATAASANAAVVVEQFDTPTLNPAWTLADEPGNYATGGGFHPSDTFYGLTNANFEQIKGETYGNLRTSLGPIGAADTARVDAKIMMRQYGVGRWSPGVAIYFDNNNWMQLREAYSGGEAGWVRQGAVNGDLWTYDAQDVAGADMRFIYAIAGIELTPTQILFYGTPVGTDHTPVTPATMDSVMQLIPEFTMPRPASFTGNAYAIVGKAFGSSIYGMNNPFLTNNGSGFLDPADLTLYDFTRVTTSDVPEPAGLSLAVFAAGGALVRRRVR